MLSLLSILALFQQRKGDSGDESELLKRIAAGDTAALEELYEQYSEQLYGIIITIVNRPADAEDILQEIFMKIWNRASSFDHTRGSAFTWIVSITRNRAIDHIRSKGYKTRQKASESIHEPYFFLEGDFRDPLQTTIQSERARLISEALDEIPQEQREVITIAYYGGLTQREIAEKLGLPLGTVKSRTRQGLIKLSNLLEDYIPIDE